ncbi:Protein tyrosine phosphatase type IVA 3 [Triplophysa tibetana]|uniref:Protein tyrosine phosphatase type IVA 3 n=1 Tax=Triplophysa tibetana TaxID=1572043 RepID=A0A5A9NMB4_9TELE|nr:Protein tyrosine phosphatase type IVA 3 [Triplophysa tibetana]
MARMNRPAPVEVCYKNMRFLITHNPTNSTLNSFIEDLKKYGATTVVRVCEITYDKTPLEKDGITVVQVSARGMFALEINRMDWREVEEAFVACHSRIKGYSLKRPCQFGLFTRRGSHLLSVLSPWLDWPFDDGAPPPSKVVEDWLSLLKRRFMEDPGCCVAVHCVAGLGRAPVLVAVALIESGMKYEDAIQFIRQKRRGAINSKQLTYLEKYRSKQRLRYKHPHFFKNKCCIM